jgi:hypothetical protein
MDRIAKSVSPSAPMTLRDDELAAVSGASGGSGLIPPINIQVDPVTVVNTGVNVGVQVAIGAVGPQTLGQGISFGTGVSIGH